jgi:rod shape-determining protein MreB and related proteins
VFSGFAISVRLETSAYPTEGTRGQARGGLGSPLPEEVWGALEEPVSHIVAAVKETLDRTPPELAGDIMDRGITLAGGGALLQGLEQRLRDEYQMPCQLAESPLTCVAVGSGISLEEVETIHRASKNNGARPRH